MSVYVELADRINEVYQLNLKPHCEERGFVKVFRKLLTEKEAELAKKLGSDLESVEDLASRMDLSSDTLRNDLHRLAEKGILYESGEGNTKAYKLMPFVPGIFEALVGISDDPDIAGYLQEYADEMKEFKKAHDETLIPVNHKIDVQTRHATLKEIELYLNQTNEFALMDCICRTVNKTNGKGCGHPIEDMCILIGDYVDYYVEIGNARRATREEVREALLKAESEGLFHEMYPIEKSKSIFVCNCCLCGCMFLELANRIRKVIKYENTVQIMKNRCTQCGTCLESCPQQVFSWPADGTGIDVDAERCFNCGLCEILCEAHAIELG